MVVSADGDIEWLESEWPETEPGSDSESEVVITREVVIRPKLVCKECRLYVNLCECEAITLD